MCDTPPIVVKHGLLQRSKKPNKENYMNNKIYRAVVHVSGDIVASYVFGRTIDAHNWIDSVLVRMQKEKTLTYTIANLDGLTVGDKCQVTGEGDEVFVIKGLIRYSDNRYGFLLDSGDAEEMYKCHALSKSSTSWAEWKLPETKE